jgi:hypothetical protein
MRDVLIWVVAFALWVVVQVVRTAWKRRRPAVLRLAPAVFPAPPADAAQTVVSDAASRPPRPRPAAQRAVAATKPAGAAPLLGTLRTPGSLAAAFVAAEILQPPLALRRDQGDTFRAPGAF